jgi:hypothetical protein
LTCNISAEKSIKSEQDSKFLEPLHKIVKEESADKIFYINKYLTKEEFQKVKSKEMEEMQKDIKANFPKQKFSYSSLKYFNMAFDCDKEKQEKLTRYAESFFKEIYPIYFDYEPAFPFRIIYFKTRPEFVKETGLNVYGFYIPVSKDKYPRITDKTLYTYCDSGTGTLWHEMIHSFTDTNVETYPPQWFSEGFAAFYEEAGLRGTKVSEGYINWRMPEFVKAIESKKNYIPLDKFLSADEMERVYGYAAARFLFCYLWLHDKMVPFVKIYLYEILPKYTGTERSKKTIEALEKLMGKTIQEIDEDYRATALKFPKKQKLKKYKD